MNKIELFKFLDILYRRRYICVLTTILVLTAATLTCSLIPKKYRVDSTVFIEKNVINDLVQGLAVSPQMKDRISVLRQALFSRDIFDKVLAKLNYDVSIPDANDYQRLLAELQDKVNLQVKDDNRFIVTMDYKDPVFAQDFINTLITTYVEESISSKRDETFGASRFMDEQVTVFKAKLDDAESTIIDYKREQDLLFTPEDDIVLDEIQKFNNEIEMLTLRRETMLAQKARLEADMAKIPEQITLFSETLIANTIFKMEGTIAQLKLSYTEDHPQILKLRAELEELKKQQEETPEQIDEEGMQTTAINPLYQEATQKLFDLETEITALAARETRLKELVAQRKAELDNVPEKKKELARLLEQRDSLRKIYELLLVRVEQSEVSKQMEIGDKATTFRILDPAILPLTPVFPNMPKMFLLTLALGFGAGIGAALVWEKLDSAIISTEQIDAFDVEIVGSIPHIAAIGTRQKNNRRDLLLLSALAVDLVLVTGFFAFEIVQPML